MNAISSKFGIYLYDQDYFLGHSTEKYLLTKDWNLFVQAGLNDGNNLIERGNRTYLLADNYANGGTSKDTIPIPPSHVKFGQTIPDFKDFDFLPLHADAQRNPTYVWKHDDI